MNDKFDYNEIKSAVKSESAKSFNKTSLYFKELIKNNIDEFIDIIPITNFISERIFTVIHLLEVDKVWDAEIILRTVLESFMKALYILTQRNPKDYAERLDEYWGVLDEIERINQSEKAKEFLKNDRILNIETIKGLILSEEEEKEIKNIPSWSNRKYRVALKNSWSYSGILLYLMKDEKTPPLISFELLQFYYKISSHIAHGDKTGINLVRRFPKPSHDRVKLQDITQYIKIVKIINDITSWLSLELAIHTANQEAINKIMDEYRKYSKYIVGVHIPLMQELNRLTTEEMDAEV